MRANLFALKLSALSDEFLETLYQLSRRLYPHEFDDSVKVDDPFNSDDLDEENSEEVDNSDDSDEENYEDSDDLDEENYEEVDNSDDSDEEDPAEVDNSDEEEDSYDSVDLNDPKSSVDDEEETEYLHHELCHTHEPGTFSYDLDEENSEEVYNSDEEDLDDPYNSADSDDLKCIVDDKEETKYVHRELCHTHEPRIFSYVVAYINIKILYRPEVTSIQGFIYAMPCCTLGGSLLITDKETLVAYDGTIKLEKSVVGIPSRCSLLIGAEQLRDQDDNLLLGTAKTFFIPMYPRAPEPDIIGDGCQLQVEVKWSPDRVFD